MDSIVLVPLLFTMAPRFADLHDGRLIRVIRADGEHLGVLHVTRQAEGDCFGAVVQFGPGNPVGDSTPPAVKDQSFAATGHAGLPVHRLTLEELCAIERTGNAEVPLTLIALQP